MKFIYFDVGGVLDKDFSATNKWDLLINKWGVSEGKKREIKELFDEFEKEVCVGRSVEDFVPMMTKKFGVRFLENYSLNKEFVDRFYINQGLEELVLTIKNKYRLGLLTNMYPGMLDMIRERNLIPNIEWEIIIDSSVVKCKKPGEEIYKIAERQAGVKSEEIFFIDNTAENLVLPKKMGWKTFWFDSYDYEQSNKELGEFLR